MIAPQEFAEKALKDFSSCLAVHLAAMGQKLGLFQLLGQSGPLTSNELAQRSGYQERYLREWLSALAAAGWLDYHEQKFSLDSQRASQLNDEMNPMYLGGFLEFIAPATSIIPQLSQCFLNGGGVSYRQHHPQMHQVVDKLTCTNHRHFLTGHWLPNLLPQLHQQLLQGREVADVGCGTGQGLIELARSYPNSRFTGYEPHPPAFEAALQRVREAEVEDRVMLVQADSRALPQERFDFVATFDVVHDVARPQELVADIYRALRPGGTYLMQEICGTDGLENLLNPRGALLFSISSLYCLPVSMALDGAGIGTCMGQSQAAGLCAQAGFEDFRKLDFEHPLAVLFCATRPGR